MNNIESWSTFQFLGICFVEFSYSFVFLPICSENTFSFFRQKSINTAAVTEQTTEAFDWRLIGFIYRGRIHWNFSHSISMYVFEYQFGFRKSHSTYLALTVLMEKLNKSIENGDHVVGVYLDFPKVFDTVTHEILLTKLNHYGIRGQALNWFRSYLESRKQFVTYDNAQSRLKNILCGVPQGFILGPLLFLIYINDLANVCKFTVRIFFADDFNLSLNGKNFERIESTLNSELE